MDSLTENYDSLYKEVCRICLSLDNDQMVALINESSELTCCGRDIETFTSISIQNVKAPPKMCQQCLMLLNQIKLFINKCKKSQAYFENIKNCSEIYRKKIVVDTVLASKRETKNTIALNMTEPKIEIKPNDLFKIPVFSNNNVGKNCIPNSDTMKPIKIETETVQNKQNTSKINLKGPNEILSLMKNNLDIKIGLVEKKFNPVQKSKINYKVSNQILNLFKNSDIKIEHISKKKSIPKLGGNNMKIPPLPTNLSQLKPVLKANYPKFITMDKFKSSKSIYICDLCKKTFKSRSSIILHLKRHVPQFHCKHCNKSCPTKRELQCHLFNKHGIGKYIKCPECDFKTGVNSELKVHKRVHTGERPYICDQCGMKFRTAYVLRNHILLHSEKAVQCLKCPLKFRNRNQLSLHDNNIHSRRNVYECPLCRRVYARVKSVRSHLAKAHSIPRDKQGKVPLIKVKDANEAQLAAAAASFPLNDNKAS